jgi:hypothetical protein
MADDIKKVMKGEKVVFEAQGTAPVEGAEIPEGVTPVSVVVVRPGKNSDVKLAPLGSDRMEINMDHARNIFGNDITVAVTAGKKDISRVRVMLDGFVLAKDYVDGQKYKRHFQMAGSTSPGREHILEVDATDVDGSVESAQERWTDLI